MPLPDGGFPLTYHWEMNSNVGARYCVLKYPVIQCRWLNYRNLCQYIYSILKQNHV